MALSSACSISGEQIHIGGTALIVFVPRIAIVRLLQNHGDLDLIRLRGAGGSPGVTSWTATPEFGDFESVAGLVILYALHIRTATLRVSTPLSVILGGYSFGSMLASRLPSASEIAQAYLGADSSPWRAKIRLEAENLARLFLLGWTPSATLRPAFVPRPSSCKTFVLLVSPLLPPVTIFLAPFCWQSFRTPTLQDHQLLVVNPTLAVFGDKDNFTGSSKLQQWAERLQAVGSSWFHYDMIHGADHFWHSKVAVASLQASIRSWLALVVERDASLVDQG